MAASLSGRLVVAISSRALFDFEEENRLFEGEDDRGVRSVAVAGGHHGDLAAGWSVPFGVGVVAAGRDHAGGDAEAHRGGEVQLLASQVTAGDDDSYFDAFALPMSSNTSLTGMPSPLRPPRVVALCEQASVAAIANSIDLRLLRRTGR